MKLLYGAAVQGIQSFIFQTNTLREIVGASELVEEICTSKFENHFNEKGVSYNNDNCILRAAGNIKYIFDSEEDCAKIVLDFPKTIQEFAPGITISQAVVPFEDNNFGKAVYELEKKLRAQRNQPMRSATLGLMGLQRSHQTGLPTIVKTESQKAEYLDAGSWAKLYEYDPKTRSSKKRAALKLCKKSFCTTEDEKKSLWHDQLAYDIEKITGKNDWIAIIHADGNGLGQVVQKIGTNISKFKEFSEKLNIATTEAAQMAFKEIQKSHILPEIQSGSKEIIPIRPIVLGGDDLTVICRADIAIDYATEFITQFEKKTKEYLSELLAANNVFTTGTTKDHLTACAGIAFVKSSYPFYYGYELAEALCTEAKKDAKDTEEIRQGRELPMSCIMFHKVQDSFTEDWNAIAARELTPQNNISFQFGPYYINEKSNRWTIDKLVHKSKELDSKEGNAVKSHLRNWMSLLHYNPGLAEQSLLRLKDNTPLKNLVCEVTKDNNNQPIYIRNEKEYYPVYDILAIHTINTQETK